MRRSTPPACRLALLVAIIPVEGTATMLLLGWRQQQDAKRLVIPDDAAVEAIAANNLQELVAGVGVVVGDHDAERVGGGTRVSKDNAEIRSMLNAQSC